MRSRGFTLVELLVVITLIAIFAMAASSLGGSWINQTRIVDTQGILDEAIGRAKAAALRNGQALMAGSAAVVCFANATLTVRESNAANTPPSCAANGSAIWNNSVPASVAIKVDGVNNLACIAFDSRANPMVTAECPSTSLTLQLTAGNQIETIRFN